MWRAGICSSPTQAHRRSQGGHGAIPPQFLKYLVILCFERRCPKQNTVASLKSNIRHPNFWPPKNFGLATPLTCCRKRFNHIRESTSSCHPRASKLVFRQKVASPTQLLQRCLQATCSCGASYIEETQRNLGNRIIF